MSLDHYTKVIVSENTTKLVKKLRELAKNYSNQYALYYYIYTKEKTTLHQLYRAYIEITDRRVRLATVRKQLKMLEERYRVIKKEGNYYIPLLPPEELLPVINIKRARAGKKGALKRILNLYKKPEQLQVPKNLLFYVTKVYEEVEKLLKKGDRTATLDLLVHTYLPLRENEVLWLWKNNEFVYWDKKDKTFRCLYSEELSKLLKKLGYSEGILAWHILGHERATKIIKKLFGKGHLNWSWSRSVAYGLMELGFLREGSYYRVEVVYKEGYLHLLLKDYYTGYLIQEYRIRWEYSQLPSPLSKQTMYYKGLALGVTHTNPKNDELYFSRW